MPYNMVSILQCHNQRSDEENQGQNEEDPASGFSAIDGAIAGAVTTKHVRLCSDWTHVAETAWGEKVMGDSVPWTDAARIRLNRTAEYSTALV